MTVKPDAKIGVKENIKILEKPRVLNANRANILAQIAVIALLLWKGFAFVVKTTCRIRQLAHSKHPDDKNDLLHHISKSILRLLQIQME